MEKLQYITRQLSRAEHKRIEFYVISRIWHLLNDLSLKFVTQQYVVRPKGRALTDMYFPQINLHIEVDEIHHLNQQEQDKLRDLDIINATNHTIEHIDTSKGIFDTNLQIDIVIDKIKQLKANSTNFMPWDIEVEQNPETYINKGFITLSDDIAFKNSYLAANCFGHKYKGLQKGGTKHPYEENTLIWFPKLYENEEWDNSITDDEQTIIELCKDEKYRVEYIETQLSITPNFRIVFSRVKSPLGDVMYRFKGKFELDKEETNFKKGLIWKRVSESVKTYKHQNSMHYQQKIDKIFGKGSLWKHRTLRTLFDPYSGEYNQTSMDKKIEILNTIRENKIDLNELLDEYKEFYIEEDKPHVVDVADGGLELLISEETKRR